MSNHGRRRAAAEAAAYEDVPVRRFGFLSIETALVLGLVVLIALGSFLVQVTFPSKHETETIIGDKKVKITTVGKGGVIPGPVQPRVIPVVVPTPAPTKAPKPPKTPKPTAGPAVPTPTPTPTKGGGGIINPGGGGGGGGGEECTVLILCKPGQKTPKPEATPTPDPAQPPGPQQPTQSPGQ